MISRLFQRLDLSVATVTNGFIGGISCKCNSYVIINWLRNTILFSCLCEIFILRARYFPTSGRLAYGPKVITLSKQTKICLEFFISRMKVRWLARISFIQECWGNRGMIVSDSTIRQSLFRLRRSFDELGINDEVILTHSKNQYMLVSGVIEAVFGEEEILAVFQEEKLNPELTFFQEQAAHEKIELEKAKLTNLTALILISVVVFFIAGLGARVMFLIKPVSYSFFDKVNGRNYYFMDGLVTNKFEAVWRAGYWLDYQMATVGESKFVYINAVRANLINVIICKGKIDDVNNACESLIVIGKEKQ